MINLDTNFISEVQPLWRKWMDTANLIGIFLSPRNITLSKIVWSYQKDILMINLDTKFHFSMCDICGTETIGRPSKRETDSSKAIYHPFSKGDINIKHRVDLLYHFNNSNAHKTDGQLINFSCSKWHWYFKFI